jgi:hypothetical protein
MKETSFIKQNTQKKHQLLVGLVMISAELGREDHSSIPHNYDQEK